MSTQKDIIQIKQKTSQVFKKYGVRRAAVFGSYARGEARAKSDVDLLIDIKPVSLVTFFDLKEDLEKKIGKDVDLVTLRALHPFIRQRVIKEQVSIYGAEF